MQLSSNNDWRHNWLWRWLRRGISGCAHVVALNCAGVPPDKEAAGGGVACVFVPDGVAATLIVAAVVAHDRLCWRDIAGRATVMALICVRCPDKEATSGAVASVFVPNGVAATFIVAAVVAHDRLCW